MNETLARRKRAVRKNVRQNLKRRLKNKKVKSEVNTLRKKVLQPLIMRHKEEITPEFVDKIYDNFKKFSSSIDRAVKKGIIQKNTAARKKSRLIKKIHQFKKDKLG